jgi:gas vesicle protein
MPKKNKLLISSIIGGALGTVVGIMLAPKKGSETREAMKKFEEEHAPDVLHVIGSVKDKAKELADEIKKTLDE